jgi:diguanylate cyclase (GGDEF)-like protein
MQRWVWTYLVVGVVASIAAVSLDGVVSSVLYLLVGLSSAVAIEVGVRLHRPQHPMPWHLMALGQLAWVAADAVYTWHEWADRSPFPSAADVLYFLAYPLLAAGIALLVLHRRQGRDRAGLVDSAIVTVAFGLLSWVVVAGPILERSGTPWVERAVLVGYPAADIILLAILVRLVTARGSRATSFRLLVAAVVLMVVADTMFAATEVTLDYPAALDALWLGSYVLWGAAALHPTMVELSRRGEDGAAPFSRARLAALAVAVLIAPVTLGIQLALGLEIEPWAVTIASIALFLLVVARMSLTIKEITTTASQRDQLQGDLSHQAAHDSLTGLANRANVLELIAGALHRGQRAGTTSGLLFIDLDHFKVVNDTHGHQGGDEVLRVCADRMRASVRDGDTVGRLGGDEFVVLMEGLQAELDAVDLADRVLAALREPIALGGRVVSVNASAGISFSLDAGTDVARLLHEADVANYRAKSAGRGRSQVFSDALRRELAEQSELEAALVRALEQGEFELYYQPVVALETGVIDGYEALIRWHRPGHEVQPPDSFIPIAEKSDLICAIDRWVLREATRQLATWTEREPTRYADLTVAVNISGRHLAEAGIVTDVREALAASGLPAHRLALEITETVLVDVPTAIAHLEMLRRDGVSISIDDFGTGYTSIGQLHRLPVDTLKIDRQFVTSTAPGAAELLSLMINAAHSSGLLVVAEGVEEATQLAVLRDLPVASVQGYLFARPRSAREMGDLPHSTDNDGAPQPS